MKNGSAPIADQSAGLALTASETKIIALFQEQKMRAESGLQGALIAILNLRELEGDWELRDGKLFKKE